MKSTEIMMQEIKAQASLFELCSTELIAQAKQLVKDYVPTHINCVHVTGCGDSYFAGIACKEAFLRLANIPCYVHQAMEFSRYVCPLEVDAHALVLSISTSGKVARTRECALRAAECGAVSIAITGNSQTPLAKVATATFAVDIPNVVGLAPGTRSYAASQLALICLAIALGEERGVIDGSKVTQVLECISQIGKAVLATVDANMDIIDRYVRFYCNENCKNAPHVFHLLGSGPNWATAQFGSMKLLESCGFTSIPTGVEEWAHSQYFTTDQNTHVIFIAPRGEARERALEIMRAVSVVDGKSIVICEQDDEQLKAAADISFCICGMKDIPEWLSHLVYAVPLEMLSMFLSLHFNKAGLDFINRPWLKEENFRQIYQSRIVSLNKGENNE